MKCLFKEEVYGLQINQDEIEMKIDISGVMDPNGKRLDQGGRTQSCLEGPSQA